jgi:diguanylate cyclase
MSKDVEALLRGPRAYDLARQVIQAMEAHHVWPTATNFELWLHYVSAKEGKVAAEINSVISSGKPFTEAIGEAIAAQHLPAARLTNELLDAGMTLTTELDNVTKALETARESSEAYGEQLASASETLAPGEDTAAVRDMVQSLSLATAKVREDNQSLEARLAETNDELGRLRDHLELVRREAMTDGLTGLYNRKAFDEHLASACRHAESSSEPLALVMVDIDHFKAFNDTWGHQTGDQVIRYVSSVIARVTAAPRFSARYGGEEFAMIFPAEKKEMVYAAVEAAREEIASRVLKRRSTSEDLGTITISSGIAMFRRGEGPQSLIDRADEAMYASKREGRNRTTVADSVASLGSQAA